MTGCLHMRMLKNVSLDVIAISITLSLFGSFVQCFCLAMLFGSFVRCFHLAICASMLVTLIFILTLEWLAQTVLPKDGKVDQPAVPKVQSVSTLGGSKNFRGGPNTSVEFGPGVQLLRGSKHYVTGLSGLVRTPDPALRGRVRRITLLGSV